MFESFTKLATALILDADVAARDARELARLPSPDSLTPATSLRESLIAIRARYGEDTAAFVALQLEYAWPEAIAQ